MEPHFAEIALDECITSDTISLTFGAPVAVANADDILDCISTSVQVNGEGSSIGSNIIYEWQGSGLLSGTTTLTPIVNQSGAYTLVVTDIENGCTSIAETIVSENTNQPSAFNLDILAPLCPGDPASIEILNIVGGEAPYMYSLNGDNFSDLSFFSGLDPGTYELVVQDAMGCEYSEVLVIPSATAIFVQVDDDIEIELGDVIDFNVFVNVPESVLQSIVWTPSTALSCDDCLSPIASPLDEILYTINVINENGCTASDDVIVRVRKNRDLFIPNAFSPHNKDGINDIFYVFSDGKSVENIVTFKIFDRWGELIFEESNFMPDDVNYGWDGYFKEKSLNPGVFIYVAEVEFIDGEVILYNGDVTLIR
jgi:gliding motility-associated-like protein